MVPLESVVMASPTGSVFLVAKLLQQEDLGHESSGQMEAIMPGEDCV